MKRLLVLIMLVCILPACKKKKSETETTTTEPTPTPKQFYVKANGQELSCNTCFSSYYSGGLRGVNFDLGGSSYDRLLINFTARPTTGTFTLVKFGDPAVTYQKNNVYYRGMGSMTITAIDTSASGTVKSIKATFTCKTDTSNGVSFDMTEGAINVTN
jgi:hypothetical protein